MKKTPNKVLHLHQKPLCVLRACELAVGPEETEVDEGKYRNQIVHCNTINYAFFAEQLADASNRLRFA